MKHLPDRIRAVFFDMDGTLIDSEPLTDLAVQALLDAYDLPPPSFALDSLHGKTWTRVAAELVEEYPALAGESLVEPLQADFDARMRQCMPRALPAAVEAFEAASGACITGVVSSSPRATVKFVVEQLGLSHACLVLVGAENVQRSKPDPECYLVAASHARVCPSDCLVFEDSEAGLEAAWSAGMAAIAVRGHRDQEVVRKLQRHASLVVTDYTELPVDFFMPFESAS